MESLDLLAPALILLVTAGLVIVVDLLDNREQVPAIVGVALLGVLLSVGYAVWLLVRGVDALGFSETVRFDRFTYFFAVFFAVVAGFTILGSTDYADRLRGRMGEFTAMTLVIAAGAILMAGANDLIALYISIELTSICQYAMAGFLRDRRSSEAGLKYLLLGATSSAVLLYGFALLFGLTGTTSLSAIGAALPDVSGDLRIGYLAAAVAIAAGFGFKMAIVPFQMWAPDVYQGAPTPVAAYLSVASKAAGFAVTLRFFYTALGTGFVAQDWANLFAVLAAVSMTVGNVMAIRQRNVRRLLGYSTIAQAGTILIAVAATFAAGNQYTLAASGVLFYLVAYACTNLGAFFAILAIAQRTGTDDISGFAGLWRRAPVLALALAFCMVSLTGLPPTAGFIAKLYVFNVAVEAGLTWLVIIGVLNTAISAFYYLGVVRAMFVEESPDTRPVEPNLGAGLTVGVAAALVLLLGIVPGPLLTVAERAASVFARG